MNNETKIKKTEKLIKKFHRITDRSIKKGDYETALESMMACSHLLSSYILPTDEYLEEKVIELSRLLVDTSLYRIQNDKKLIFYDGVCNDDRGLRLTYLNALLDLGYEVIYLTDKEHEGFKGQPKLEKLARGRNLTAKALDSSEDIISKIRSINKVINEAGAQTAFYYAFPHDVAGAIVFTAYEGIVQRFKIVLSDMNHNIGNRLADKYIEFREYGAFYSQYKRGIPCNRITMLPLFPYIDESIEFKGLPFDDIEGKKIVFSGGGTHKILDKDNTFAGVINRILEFPDILFIYAGYTPDPSYDDILIRIKTRYPDRVALIPAREDLYQLMEHVDYYFDTYPLGGGLMINYALAAGTVTLSLCTDDRSILKSNPLNSLVYYNDPEQLLEEFKKLKSNEGYYTECRELIRQNYPDKSGFTRELSQVLDGRSHFTDNKKNEYLKDFNRECESLTSIMINEYSYDYFMRRTIKNADYRKMRSFFFSAII